GPSKSFNFKDPSPGGGVGVTPMAIPNPLREKHPAAPYALINPAAPTASAQGWSEAEEAPSSGRSRPSGQQENGRSRPSGLQKDAVKNSSSLPQAGAQRSEAPLMREGGVIPRCDHIRLSGQQCGSPALRGQKF